MKKTAIILLMLISWQVLFSGTVTITLVGVDPLTIRVSGATGLEEAGGIGGIYLYYNDNDGTTLIEANVDASAIEGSGGFNWGTNALWWDKAIESGSWDVNSRTYKNRLFYMNNNFSEVPGDDDYWATGGINAIICDFSVVGTGHAYVVSLGTDAFTDFEGSSHTINYGTQEASLPVQMSFMEAEATNEGIEIRWTTQSEVNSQGFQIWRSLTSDGEYEQITGSLIQSQGNSSSGADYTYTDKNMALNAQYYYKIQEKSTDGSTQMHGPIEVKSLYIPVEYALSQNYPNPFNPVTSFTYDIPEPSDVQIRVYSLLGEEVKVLVNERQMPGRYPITWDGTDQRGQQLSSGVYFLRIDAGTFTKMKKMTLLR